MRAHMKEKLSSAARSSAADCGGEVRAALAEDSRRGERYRGTCVSGVRSDIEPIQVGNGGYAIMVCAGCRPLPRRKRKIKEFVKGKRSPRHDLSRSNTQSAARRRNTCRRAHAAAITGAALCAPNAAVNHQHLNHSMLISYVYYVYQYKRLLFDVYHDAVHSVRKCVRVQAAAAQCADSAARL